MIKKDCLKFKVCTEASGSTELPCETCKQFIPRPGTVHGINKKNEIVMSKNLIDLNKTLFEQLERLNNAPNDALSDEISRSKAICGVSTQIVNNAALALRAHEVISTGMSKTPPPMLMIENE